MIERDYSYLPDRILLLMDLSGCRTQASFANSIGVVPSAISRTLLGKNKKISSTTAERMSRLLGVSYDWITKGEGKIPTKAKLVKSKPREGTVVVEILTCAGLGITYNLENNNPIETVEISKKVVTRDGKVINEAILCKGDSMYPTILDGGIVGVDFDDKEVAENKIFLLRFPCLGLTVKRLEISKDGYLAVADNPLVKEQLIPVDYIEQGVILGRVRWIYNMV